MTTTPSIGLTELRRNISAIMRRVDEGESFAVTERGHVVAYLRPHPDKPADAMSRRRAAASGS